MITIICIDNLKLKDEKGLMNWRMKKEIMMKKMKEEMKKKKKEDEGH